MDNEVKEEFVYQIYVVINAENDKPEAFFVYQGEEGDAEAEIVRLSAVLWGQRNLGYEDKVPVDVIEVKLERALEEEEISQVVKDSYELNKETAESD
jgi:hypothetical protein